MQISYVLGGTQTVFLCSNTTLKISHTIPSPPSFSLPVHLKWQLVNMEPAVLEIAGCSHTKREAVNWAQIDYMIVEGLSFWVLDSLVDEGWETVKPEH